MQEVVESSLSYAFLKLEVSNSKQGTLKVVIKEAKKVAIWVKLTRSGTANRLRHTFKESKLKHICFAAFLFQLSPFGWFCSVFFFPTLFCLASRQKLMSQ